MRLLLGAHLDFDSAIDGLVFDGAIRSSDEGAFAFAEGLDAVGAEFEGFAQPIDDGEGAGLAELEIVVVGAEAVGMAFDDEEGVGIFLDEEAEFHEAETGAFGEVCAAVFEEEVCGHEDGGSAAAELAAALTEEVVEVAEAFDAFARIGAALAEGLHFIDQLHVEGVAFVGGLEGGGVEEHLFFGDWGAEEVLADGGHFLGEVGGDLHRLRPEEVGHFGGEGFGVAFFRWGGCADDVGDFLDVWGEVDFLVVREHLSFVELIEFGFESIELGFLAIGDELRDFGDGWLGFEEIGADLDALGDTACGFLGRGDGAAEGFETDHEDAMEEDREDEGKQDPPFEAPIITGAEGGGRAGFPLGKLGDGGHVRIC